jgi:uncharacterized protein YdaL
VIAGAIVAGALSTPAYAAAPVVTSVTPTAGSTGVPVDVRPTATFNQAVDAGSLRYSFVKTSTGSSVAGYTGYDAPTRTFTLIPRAVLAGSTRYTITLKVKASTGALSKPYTYSFTTRVVDASAPSAPASLVAGPPTATSVDLTWNPSTDNVGVTAYEVYASTGGAPMATVAGSPPASSTTLTDLTPSTAYSVTVRARDAAGNLSAPSNAASFTTPALPPPPDTTAPSAPGTPVVGDLTATTATLTWADSTDAVGVAGYRVTGGPVPVSTTEPHVSLTNLTPLTSYTVTVQAFDAAGNVSGASTATTFTTPKAELPNARSGEGIPGSTGNTLVLYDSTGPYAFLGEQYAIATANLMSHFGSWTAQPVADYAAGELEAFDAVVYVGSTYDEPLPLAFLDDVTSTSKPVVWMYDNIWQLTARDPQFAANRGFTWTGFDFASVTTVNYKGKAFARDALNGSGIMGLSITDSAKVRVVADAVRADGSTLPWGVTSGNFTYLGEIPYSYISTNDRYLAFSDLLIDVLAPATAERHRALVRIEDVGPDAEPSELRAITNYLYGKGIPFSVAVYPRYRDPNGVDNGGVAQDYTLAQRPQVVAELKYMQSHGGTLLMHGYTHQYSDVNNPYNGVSADDFEFYRAHVDANESVIYDGPVAEDSEDWTNGRIDSSFAAFTAADLGTPTIFEFPHYAASDAANRAMAKRFEVRYDRGVYAVGSLRGGSLDYSRILGQFFPYAVRDIYGVLVVPENIGNIELEAFNNHPARLPADLIASAELNLAVRDGVASFFFHPYLPVSYLQETVEGVQAAGYTFTPASQF